MNTDFRYQFTAPVYSLPRGRGNEVDLRSDIYSLGCTLYFLLVGRQPFWGDTAIDIVIKHRTEPVPEIPGAPDPLMVVI